MKCFPPVIVALLLTMNSFGQVRDVKDIPKRILDQIDSMALNTLPTINCNEGAYLNVIFQDSLKGFDLTGKMVGFLKNGRKSDKTEYFGQVKERYRNNSSGV